MSFRLTVSGRPKPPTCLCRFETYNYRANSVVTLLAWIPPYASRACANDILSSPRPIRAARASAKKRPMFPSSGGRFDPLESLYEVLEKCCAPSHITERVLWVLGSVQGHGHWMSPHDFRQRSAYGP